MSPTLPFPSSMNYRSAAEQMHQNALQDARNNALSGGRGKKNITQNRRRSHRRRTTRTNGKTINVKRTSSRPLTRHRTRTRTRGILRKSRRFRSKNRTKSRRVRWNSKYRYHGESGDIVKIPAMANEQ